MISLYNNYSIYLNILVNILTIIVILYCIYKIITEYQNEKQFSQKNITSYSDLEQINNKYQNTKLYNIFHNLSDDDKEYLYHIINAERLKYKEKKPKITKKINLLKSQLIYNMIITLLIKQKFSAVIDSFKHNTLLTFFNAI